MNQLLTINDKVFKPFISKEQLSARVKELAANITNDLKEKKPLFLAVLNGSFMFASDLLKELKLECNISFIKLSSYTGMKSEGTVKELIGLNEDINNRTIVILEDIVDSGLTVQTLEKELNKRGAAAVHIATVLFKPAAFKGKIEPKYIGFKIENDFVIGYGMDYEGLGRNLNEIYVLA